MIVALLLTTVLLALSMGLVVLTNVETAVAGNFRGAAEALQAADAGLQIAVGRLSDADWTVALEAVEPPPCRSYDDQPLLPTGFYPTDRWGADSPVWRLYACVPMRALLPPDAAIQPPTVGIWLADDASDADGDPILDTNQRLSVRAEARGPSGAHAAVEATLEREGAGVRILSWRALR